MSITRRGFTSLAGAPLLQAQSPSRPNIVVILSDDHTTQHLGAFGNPVIQTPNLDRFASQGMKFDRMFTAAPQCVPSRTAIMTGRSPVACRMGRFTSPLPPDVVTMPELLRAQGYYTGICRRLYHLDGPGRKLPVSSKVFEEHGLTTFDKRVDWLDKNSTRAQTQDRVNTFLDKVPAGRPFFLWVNFNDPHHKWDDNAIPKPHDPAKIPVPSYLPDVPGMRADLARYYDEISRMDAEFQMVIDILEKRGHSQNTVVMFMGDNGYAFPHGKGSLYDPGLNVPLVIRWPGKVKAGSASSELLSGEDVTPTLLAAAGVTAPASMSGKSFLPLLTGRSTSGPRENIFAARLPHGGSPYSPRASNFDLSRCVRTKTHKLIYNCTPQQEYWPVDSGADAGWQQVLAAHKAGKLKPEHEKAYFSLPRPVFELFDLEKDPAEMHNVAEEASYAKVRRQLTEIMMEKMILDYDFLPLPLNE
jgi:arylsulfatase A-like enzyme